MNNIYKIEVCSGYMIETEKGYNRPPVIKTLTFDNYHDALTAYKTEKAKKAGAVVMYKNNLIKHFKTI